MASAPSAGGAVRGERVVEVGCLGVHGKRLGSQGIGMQRQYARRALALEKATHAGEQAALADEVADQGQRPLGHQGLPRTPRRRTARSRHGRGSCPWGSESPRWSRVSGSTGLPKRASTRLRMARFARSTWSSDSTPRTMVYPCVSSSTRWSFNPRRSMAASSACQCLLVRCLERLCRHVASLLQCQPRPAIAASRALRRTMID